MFMSSAGPVVGRFAAGSTPFFTDKVSNVNMYVKLNGKTYPNTTHWTVYIRL